MSSKKEIIKSIDDGIKGALEELIKEIPADILASKIYESFGLGVTSDLIENLSKTEYHKEKQEFQLGDTAYMVDEDYRFFEGEVYKIELNDGKYEYTADGADFTNDDIGDWVFTSKEVREMHVMNL